MVSIRFAALVCLLSVLNVSLAQTLVMPHLPTDNTLWRSMLQADNTGAAAVGMDVTLYDEGEQVLNQRFTVEAGAEVQIDLSELAPGASFGRVARDDDSLHVRLSYAFRQSGGVAEFALTETTASRLGFFFSDFAGSIAWKGIGLANTADQTASVQLTAWGGGNVLGQTTLELPANSRTRGLHTEWFPDVPFADIKKIIAASEQGGLAGVSISGSGDSSQLLFGLAEALLADEEPFTIAYPAAPVATIFDGRVVDADYWSEDAKILSAGLGFCDIVGLPFDTLTEDLVRQTGGAWLSDLVCGADENPVFTSSVLEAGLRAGYVARTPFGPFKDGALAPDGLPVVFSWPLDTSTINITDIRVTLNTGEVVMPDAASPWPNIEENERNIVVIFGEFGNRKPSSDPESRFPVRVEVVADDNPLMLVNPNGERVSAVGLSWENTGSPYDANNGPRLVGAKLNRIDSGVAGEGIANPVSNLIVPPNDAFQLYGGGDFRIRILTSGGFSPDGVRGVLPTDYERFFRIHARGVDGETVLLEQTDVDYALEGGTLRVVGLSDLGRPEGSGVVYSECYQEDRDNYIDIILVGDEAAARTIEFVEIPSLAGGYGAFYNPGGPGTTPFPEVTYTAPGPPDLEPVIIALDNPMRVTLQ